MSLYLLKGYYYYEFFYKGQRKRGATGQRDKEKAREVEKRERERLERPFEEILKEEARAHEQQTINAVADTFLEEYKLEHPDETYAEYALRPVKRLLGKKLVLEITDGVVHRYQLTRRKEDAAPKTINEEVMMLLRICGDHGELVRMRLKRKKALRIKVPASPGRAYSAKEKAALLADAKKRRSPNFYPALVLALNTGLRLKELRTIKWEQIDLLDKKTLTVGKSKTDAGTGRVVPLNVEVLNVLQQHAAWFVRKFGECKPEWYVFPFGQPQPTDPRKPVTTFKTAWANVRKNTKVEGRWHDHRHTVITELSENGTSREAIKSMVGHVSDAMVERYSHIRMEAKRAAVEEIAKNQRAANKKWQKEMKKQQQKPAAAAGGVQ